MKTQHRLKIYTIGFTKDTEPKLLRGYSYRLARSLLAPEICAIVVGDPAHALLDGALVGQLVVVLDGAQLLGG
jgi:hypothetical protein